MKNKKNTIMLVVIVISLVILTWNKSYSYEMNDNIPEEKEVERKEFGIYLEKSQGSSKTDSDYKEATEFPKQGYLLNTNKTKCYEYGTNKEVINAVEQSLTNGVIDGTIIVQSTKSMYCKIYFDKDDTLPTVSTLTLKGKDKENKDIQDYTYNQSVAYTITFKDNDIAQYCVSEGIECTEWEQITVTNKTINGKIDVSENDGVKEIYVYLKDKANNVSTIINESHKKITLDSTTPEVTLTLSGTPASNDLTLESGYTHTTAVKYNGTITEANMEGYCISESNCSDYTTTTEKVLTNKSYTLTDTEGSHTVTISVKDKAGNIGSTTQTITLDKTNPTITLTQKSVTESSIVVNVKAEDTNGIKSVTCSANGNGGTTSGTYNKDSGTCTFSSLKDGTQYTITGEATDGSGRKKTSNSISVTTKKAGLTGSDLLKSGNRPKGLSTKLLGDMYRFVGTKNNVDNYICFGTESKCSETDDYMYRIIGITEDGQLKLIKNTAIREGTYYYYRWYKNYTEDITWPNSDIFKRLNGKGTGSTQGYDGNTNLFINSDTSNVQYVKTTGDTTWYNKIDSTHEWLYGGIYNDNLNNTADEIYKIETGKQEVQQNYGESATSWTSGTQAAVGLMYVSDFYYSYATDGSDSSKTNCFSNRSCKNSWLHISQNGKSNDYQIDWTMTRFGRSSGRYYTWGVHSTGDMYDWYLNDDSSVRPVFYLNSDVEISNSIGTSGNPFIIKK